MGRASQEFDRQLFNLKLSELSHQMQIRSAVSDRKAAVSQDIRFLFLTPRRGEGWNELSLFAWQLAHAGMVSERLLTEFVD